MIFWIAKNVNFWSILGPLGKSIFTLLGHVLSIFRDFSCCWAFSTILLIFLAQACQKCQKNNEKTSLATSLATSSSPPTPHQQCLTNKAERTALIDPWHPHQSFQLNGRAVVPALPVQSAARSSRQACQTLPSSAHLQDNAHSRQLPQIIYYVCI